MTWRSDTAEVLGAVNEKLASQGSSMLVDAHLHPQELLQYAVALRHVAFLSPIHSPMRQVTAVLALLEQGYALREVIEEREGDGHAG
jgi:hypothetical protein